MKQRILFLMLAVSLFLSLFTTGAWAAETEPLETELEATVSAAASPTLAPAEVWAVILPGQTPAATSPAAP